MPHVGRAEETVSEASLHSGTSGTSGAEAHFRAGASLGIFSQVNIDQDGDLRDADTARRITQYTGQEDA